MHTEHVSKHTHKRRSFGLLVLRIGLGVIFIAHGAGKLSGMEGTVQFFASMGFGSFVAHLVAYVELLAGIAILLGIATRVAAAMTAVIMAVVLLSLKMKAPITGMGGMELELMLFVASVALSFMGGGRFAIGPKSCMCCKTGMCSAGGCPCHAFCGGGACGKACDGCDSCKDGVCAGHEEKN